MEEWKIIKAEPQDAAKIHQLIANVLGSYNLYYLRPKYVDNDINDLDGQYFDRNGYFWIVVNQDNQIIGTCAIYHTNNKTCELRKMYLETGYHNRVMGKSLLEIAKNKAKELGYSKIVLKTNSKLLTAIKLYTKNGFIQYSISEQDQKADCDVAMYSFIS